MKRIFNVFSIVLIGLFAFVACSPQASFSDELVSVSLVGSQGKTRSLVAENDFDISSVSVWKYTAEKADSGLKSGETGTGKTNAVALADGNTGALSQGSWNFELFGYNADGALICSGSADNQTITVEHHTVKITVKPSQTETGKIVVDSAINIVDKNGTVYSGDVYTMDYTVKNSSSEDVTETVKAGTAVKSGQYKVTVVFTATSNGETYTAASASKFINVYDNLTTTVSGTITETEQAAAITAEGGMISATSESFEVAVENGTNKAEVSIPVASTPVGTTDSAKKTTVTFPAGALNLSSSDTSADVSLKVESTSIESAATSYSVETSEGAAVASFNFELVGAENAEFNGDKGVEITTYIAKGLGDDAVSIKYVGTSTGKAPELVSYTSETGELKFKVFHFSTYLVLSQSTVAIDNKGNIYTSLESAVSGVASGDKITLLKDITVENTIEVKKSFSLDLNGKTIKSTTRVFLIHGGAVSIDNGTIEAAISNKESSVIRVSCKDDCTDATEEISFTVGSNAIIKGTTSYGVTAFGKKDATVNVYGTIESANAALAGNGSLESGYEGKFILNVYDGASLTANGAAATYPDASGIYQPDGDTVLNIYGGTVTSTNFSALEIRGGNANISGGTFTSGADTYSCGKTPAGGGPTTKGAAIAVAPYYGNIDVVISNGTFNGEKQLAVVNPESLKAEATENVKVEIKSNCNFDATKIWAEKASDFDGIAGSYTVKPNTIWDGSSVTTDWYLAGSDSLKISKASDLAGFAKLVNEGISFEGKTVCLSADIDLNGNGWTPIGQYKDENGKDFEKQFSGIFDGQNHIIKGLKIDCTTGKSSYRALFGYVDGTVQNFTVYGDVSGIDVAGVVAALDKGGVVNNVTSYVNVSNKTENAATAKTGGIVITNKDKNSKEPGWTISNCKNYGTVSSNSTVANDSVGGILGWTADSTGKLKISNCENHGKVSAAKQPAGGIVGGCRSIIIEGCKNEGTISSTGAAAGGIVAYNDTYNLTIKNCSNAGSVSGASNMTGAIGGFIKGSLEDCTTTGDIALVGTLGDGSNENSISYSSETAITAPSVVKGSLSLKNVKVSSLSLIYVNRAGDLTIALDSSTIDSMTVTMEQNESESRLFLTKEGTSSISSLKFTGSFDAQNVNTYGKLYLFGNEVVDKENVTNELIYVERFENNGHPTNAPIYWNAAGTKDSYTDSTTDPIKSIKTYNSSSNTWEEAN